MDKKISVIVPVYNVAVYLPECLESILRQSYENIEIILVDDGSTDHSGVICDNYAERDSRIIVIHQKNGGAASAKNAGLKRATGEYLSFVDSDDVLEAGAFSHMVSVLETNTADVVQCSFRELFTNGTIDHVVLTNRCIFSAQEYLIRYTTDWTCCLLWDKLYKRALFEGILFEEGHIVDDEYFTYQGIMRANKVIHDPQIIYNYRKRCSSVTIKPEYKERTIIDKLDYLEKRRKNIANVFPELSEVFDRHYLDMLIWLSRDPQITELCIDLIKEKVNFYLKSTQRIRIDWRRRLNLLKIQHKQTRKLVSERDVESEIDINNYFT